MRLLADSFPTAEDMINKIKTQINDHISDENQFDDITIMALRRSE
jgi:serine phosphatase RsbU (regulator of sigma subunit)